MKYAIDRFEDTQAVLQDDNGNTLVIDRSCLPQDAKQGDVLTLCNGVYCHDREETTARRTRVQALQQLLRSKKRKDA